MVLCQHWQCGKVGFLAEAEIGDLDAAVRHATIQSHVIEIVAEGAFGSFRFCEDVLPSADNPKTGRLVAMAVIKTIRQLAAPVVIGG
jgi:predicted dinucleotide-utilizing enzyme